MNNKEKELLNDYEELFRANRNALPESSSHKNPKMEYHVAADGVFWNDEGLKEIEWELSNAFRFVINYRTKLIINSNKPNELYQHI